METAERVVRKRNRGVQPRSGVTRAALLAAARDLFARAGYHASGTTELAASAALTRGALYHHFPTKEALFEAIYREVAVELSDIAKAGASVVEGQAWQRMIASIRIYLSTVAARPDIQRILLIDGPVVLGWERWRAIQSELRLSDWMKTLQLLHQQGVLAEPPTEPLAHLLVVLLDDASLSVAHAANPADALEQVTKAAELLLRGLRTTQ